MPKGEHMTVSTTLEVAQVKSILSAVLDGANIESLNQGPLDGDTALAILATRNGGAFFNKSPFGVGNACAQFIVEDHGSARRVELIALKNTIGESWNRQRGAGNAMAGLAAAREAPNIKAGRKMVEAVLEGLTQADPNIQQTQ